MGLQIDASILCDNCNLTTASLEGPDAPLPNDWLRVQGYAISNDSSVAIEGYFCPQCIASVGSRALVKKAADISSGLTDV